jgi:hypothetical protein
MARGMGGQETRCQQEVKETRCQYKEVLIAEMVAMMELGKEAATRAQELGWAGSSSVYDERYFARGMQGRGYS